jgi:hypothetical protein
MIQIKSNNERVPDNARVSVRWDAAASDSGFWSKPAGASCAAPAPGTPVAVLACLFGSLACASSASPIELELPHPFTARDVVEALARRLGAEFRARVLDAAGRKYRHCRIFADGLPAEDLDAPLRAGAGAARIEMILLTAAEGG